MPISCCLQFSRSLHVVFFFELRNGLPASPARYSQARGSQLAVGFAIGQVGGAGPGFCRAMELKGRLYMTEVRVCFSQINPPTKPRWTFRPPHTGLVQRMVLTIQLVSGFEERANTQLGPKSNFPPLGSDEVPWKMRFECLAPRKRRAPQVAPVSAPRRMESACRPSCGNISI